MVCGGGQDGHEGEAGAEEDPAPDVEEGVARGAPPPEPPGAQVLSTVGLRPQSEWQ